MIRRLLVTGAGGLVGRELLPALGSGPDEVFALGRSPADLPAYRVCDLGDPEATRRVVAEIRPDAVIHLAGGTAASRHALYRDNVLSTVHLLEAAAGLAAAPYCIVLGSAAEYGNIAAELIDETSPLEPCTAYGRAKAAQTTLAESICRQHGIPLTVLRPFNLVSPHLPLEPALGSLRRQLLASGVAEEKAPGEGSERKVRRVRCGRLDVIRDFVPVAFVVAAMQRLLAAPAPGLTINVCSGVGIELGELLTAMARRLGVELAVEIDPVLAALPAAPRAVGDPARLRQRLGLAIAPTPEALAELLLAD